MLKREAFNSYILFKNMNATYIILHYRAELLKRLFFPLLISWSREQTRQRVIRETIWRLTVFDTSDQAVICTKSTFENTVKKRKFVGSYFRSTSALEPFA